MLREDAVYQGRELFFEGESCSSRELFFGRADAVHQQGREDIFHQQGTEALSIDGGMDAIRRRGTENRGKGGRRLSREGAIRQ